MKWYTAVGVKIESPEGTFRVRVGTMVKDLLGMECYIWNTLLWAFVGEKQIYGRMLRLLSLTFPEGSVQAKADLEDFKNSFQRLLIRGLITFRESDTREEAVRAAFRESSVAGVDRNFGERFLSFCESVADGKTLRSSLQMFQKNPLEREHRELLKTIQKSGAEGFCLKEATEEQLSAVIGLHGNKLLFIQSIKGELFG